jgi:hypothetical protein
MDIFGDLERFLSEDLYPYRIPVTLAVVVVIAVLGWVAYRRGWIARLWDGARARPIPSAVALVVALAVVVPAGYYLASPLWTRTTLVEASPLAAAASETPNAATGATSPSAPTSTPQDATSSPTGDAALPRTVLEGEWMGADDFHFARGRALVVETAPGTYVLRVEEFSVRNGPDLFVYISADPNGYNDDAIELGTLKATDGAFNYEIPAGVSLEQIQSAVVWCKQFAVLFGSASLQ